VGCSRANYGGKILLEDAEKIKEGMGKKEVIALLGRPHSSGKTYLLYTMKPEQLVDESNLIPAYLNIRLQSNRVLGTSYIWQGKVIGK